MVEGHVSSSSLLHGGQGLCSGSTKRVTGGSECWSSDQSRLRSTVACFWRKVFEPPNHLTDSKCGPILCYDKNPSDCGRVCWDFELINETHFTLKDSVHKCALFMPLSIITFYALLRIVHWCWSITPIFAIGVEAQSYECLHAKLFAMKYICTIKGFRHVPSEFAVKHKDAWEQGVSTPSPKSRDWMCCSHKPDSKPQHINDEVGAFNVLSPLLRHGVPLNSRNCPLTMTVVNGCEARAPLPAIPLFKWVKPTSMPMNYFDYEVVNFIESYSAHFDNNGPSRLWNCASDWYGKYGVTHPHSLYTRLLDVAHMAALEKMMSFFARIRTIMSW